MEEFYARNAHHVVLIQSHARKIKQQKQYVKTIMAHNQQLVANYRDI